MNSSNYLNYSNRLNHMSSKEYSTCRNHNEKDLNNIQSQVSLEIKINYEKQELDIIQKRKLLDILV